MIDEAITREALL